MKGISATLLGWVRRYPLFIIVLVVTLLVGAVLLAPVTQEQDILAPRDIGNRVLFGRDQVVAQQFIAEAGLSAIRVAVGSQEGLVNPLILHIRSERDGDDIRTIPLFFTDPDTETLFSFQPLVQQSSQKMWWLLEAPHAKRGDFWVFREQDESAYPEGDSYLNSRHMRGNYGFTLYVTRPYLLAWWAGELGQESGDGWHEWERTALAVSAIIILLGAWIFRRKLWLSERFIVIALVGVSVLWHIAFAIYLPAIHDEGAYIQDVLQINHGILPFKDALTKGPLFLFMVYIWQWGIPNLLVAWRLLSVGAAVVTVWLIFKLTQGFGFTRRERLFAVIGMALLPASVALTTPLLLQVLSVPFVLLGMWLVWRGMGRQQDRYFIWAAVAMTAAYCTRVSSAIGALAAFLLILFFSRRRWREATLFVGSGLSVFAIIIAITFLFLGWEKTAIMFNFEALLISQQRGVLNAQVAEAEPIIRSLVLQSRLLWQMGLALILPVFLWPLFFISRQAWWRSLLLFFGMIYILTEVYRHWTDMGFLLPFSSSIFPFLATVFIFGVPFVVTLIQFLRDQRWRPEGNRSKLGWWLFIWIALLTVVYGQWGRFRQSYLTEFIPPLVLLAALSYERLIRLWQKADIRPIWFGFALKTIGICLFVITYVFGAYAMFAEPFTGTVDRISLHAMTDMVREHVPIGEAIFTAQPIVTAFADRPIMFGYSHPGWYREERLGYLSSDLLAVFFQHPAAITAYLANEARYVVLDRRTDEIYFDGVEERRTILNERFELVDTVVNAQEGEEIKLYRRKP